MSLLRRLLAALGLFVAAGASATAPATPVQAATAIKDPENTLIMQLKTGRVVIEMRPDLAPHHVARIKELVR